MRVKVNKTVDTFGYMPQYYAFEPKIKTLRAGTVVQGQYVPKLKKTLFGIYEVIAFQMAENEYIVNTNAISPLADANNLSFDALEYRNLEMNSENIQLEAPTAEVDANPAGTPPQQPPRNPYTYSPFWSTALKITAVAVVGWIVYRIVRKKTIVTQ